MAKHGANSGRLVQVAGTDVWNPQRKDRKMTVRDCMREIRRVEDAIDTLNKYSDGKIQNIGKQHIDEIREMLEHYMDVIAKMNIAT